MSTKLAPQQDFTLGSDPEVFAINEQGDYFPCIGLLGGTKKKPLPIQHGFIQEDNVMAEFNTIPAKTKEEFLTNVVSIREEVRKILSQNHLAMAEVSRAEFKNEHLRHRQAHQFGCDPDECAYAVVNTVMPEPNVRTAGGHLHIGLPNQRRGWARGLNTRAQVQTLVIALDMVIYPINALIDPNGDRMMSYGTPGRYRRKPYGIEYRSPSNWWLFKDEYINTIYELTNLAIYNWLNGREGYNTFPLFDSPMKIKLNQKINFTFNKMLFNEKRFNTVEDLVKFCNT